jgi:AraC-like DNA-binding protein
MKKEAISLHRDELKDIGVKLWRVSEPIKGRAQLAHRDDHFMFIIQQKGEFLWELDFNEVKLSGPSVCFIAPGQVHRYIDVLQTDAWLVFADMELIPAESREIFEANLNARQIVNVEADNPVFQLVEVLNAVVNKQGEPLQRSLLGSLIASLAGMVASKLVKDNQTAHVSGGQQYQLVIRFKQLLSEKFKEVKQVQAYAALLNITPLYLNEVVKTVTGFAASYWINQQVLLEAKRLLYYTSIDVKQVAFQLGYEDHTYFSRLFKKHTGITALGFRASKP